MRRVIIVLVAVAAPAALLALGVDGGSTGTSTGASAAAARPGAVSQTLREQAVRSGVGVKTRSGTVRSGAGSSVTGDQAICSFTAAVNPLAGMSAPVAARLDEAGSEAAARPTARAPPSGQATETLADSGAGRPAQGTPRPHSPRDASGLQGADAGPERV